MIKLRAIADCTIQLEKVALDGSSEILFGLLAHLVVERGKPVPRSRLVDAFWWNADESDGRHCLRQSIYKLRQLGAPIESGVDTFTLGERAALADFDCADERTLALSPLPPEEAVAIFPGYAPRASAPFLTWLERTREKAGRAVRGVLVRALGEARRRNGWEEAAKLARQCLVLDPLNEEATLTLAEYTALQGDKREALRLIDTYMEEIGGTYGDLRIPASLLRNRISERVAYPPASAAGKIPLVGRDDSLRVLAGVSAEVSGGAGQTCVVHGPPGIGKTRLLREFANISAMKGARIVRVDCHADAAERALSVFMELAPQLLRMPGALGCAPEALRLVRRLGRHDPTERLDPEEYGGAAFLHAAVRASLRDLIDAIAAERPLYLLIEDVHWIDPVSLEVLKEIIGSNRTRQLLVLMTTRTLADGTLLAGVDRRQLIVHELAPLGGDAARRLAETLCGALAIQADAQLLDWCMQRGAGNPLFMSELLAHWRETKDTDRVPASLEALIDERVGAFREAALRTLQAIALLEGEATYEMLEAVLGMQRWQVMGCVEELDKGGVVCAAADVISTRHYLIGARAVATLRPALKAAMHNRIARVLEQRAQRVAEPGAILCAINHFALAGDAASALRLALDGARHLEAVGAQMAAAALLKQAMRFAVTPDEQLALFDRRRELLLVASAYDEALLNSREALELKRNLNKKRRIHDDHELASFGLLHQPTTVAEDNGDWLREMLPCVESAEAPMLHRLKAAYYGLAGASNDGSAALAERFWTAVIAVQPTTVQEHYSHARCGLIYHTLFGSLTEAIKWVMLVEEVIPRLTGDSLASAHRICGYAYQFSGDLNKARAKFELAHATASDAHLPAHAGTALINWASTYSYEREHDLAWKFYQRGVSLFEQNAAPFPGTVMTCGATFAFLRGDIENGVRLVRAVPDMRPLRYRLDKAAVELYAAFMAEAHVSDDLLARAMAMYEPLSELGVMDFAAMSLANAISSRSPESAQEFVRRYLSRRRERCSIGMASLLAFASGSATPF